MVFLLVSYQYSWLPGVCRIFKVLLLQSFHFYPISQLHSLVYCLSGGLLVCLVRGFAMQL